MTDINSASNRFFSDLIPYGDIANARGKTYKNQSIEQQRNTDAGAGYQPSAAALAAYRYDVSARFDQKQSLNFQLVTQEGDVVTVQFNRTSRAALERQASLVQASSGFSVTEGLSSNQVLRLSRFGDFEFQIIGDLDEDEQVALLALVTDLNELSQSFFAGDTARAQSLAANLQLDGSEFYSLDLDLASETNYRALETYSAIQAYSSNLLRSGGAANREPNALASSDKRSQRDVPELAEPTTAFNAQGLFALLDQLTQRLEQFTQQAGREFTGRSSQDLLALFLQPTESLEQAKPQTLENVDVSDELSDKQKQQDLLEENQTV